MTIFRKVQEEVNNKVESTVEEKLDKEESEEIDVLCDMIRDQVASELKNQRMYLDFAATLSYMGCTVFANYMYQWSNEEQEHATRFMNFLIKKGKNPKICGTEYEHKNLDCICDITEEIFQREKLTTQKIEKIYDQACKMNCPMTKELALSFMKEQLEEEAVALSLLKMWEKSEANIVDFEMQVDEFMTKKKKHLVGNLGEKGYVFY